MKTDLFKSDGPYVVTSHVNPDGDAIGSVLALYHFLTARGSDVSIFLPSPCPRNLQWLPGSEHITVWSNADSEKKIVANSAVTVVLDLNSLNRLESLATSIKESGATIVNIDHHMQPETFAHIQINDESAPSTTYMLADLLDFTGSDSQSAIATCLYVGLMTDTGSFRFPRTDASVMRLAADLIERGADPVKCYEMIYNVESINRTRMLGQALANMQLYHNGRLCVMTLTSDDLMKHQCTLEDTEGFVHHTLSVQGVQMGALLIEVPGTIKCSFRSKGEVYVRDLAAKYGGGGHVYAAGARIPKRLSEVVDLVVSEASTLV